MSTTTYIEKLSRIEKDEYQKAAFDSQSNTVVLAGQGRKNNSFDFKSHAFAKWRNCRTAWFGMSYL